MFHPHTSFYSFYRGLKYSINLKYIGCNLLILFAGHSWHIYVLLGNQTDRWQTEWNRNTQIERQTWNKAITDCRASAGWSSSTFGNKRMVVGEG